MIRLMNEADVESIVGIHLNSWSADELSVKLGQSFVRRLYTHVVEADSAFGYVYEKEGKIIGYAVGYHDYHAFNQAFDTFSLLPLVLSRFLTGRLKISDIINGLSEQKKFRKAQFANHHLGALALSPSYKHTPLGKEAITGVLEAVIEEFIRQNYLGCSLVCDEKNIPLRKYLDRLQFELIDTIPLIGRTMTYYERVLA